MSSGRFWLVSPQRRRPMEPTLPCLFVVRTIRASDGLSVPEEIYPYKTSQVLKCMYVVCVPVYLQSGTVYEDVICRAFCLQRVHRARPTLCMCVGMDEQECSECESSGHTLNAWVATHSVSLYGVGEALTIWKEVWTNVFIVDYPIWANGSIVNKQSQFNFFQISLVLMLQLIQLLYITGFFVYLYC